MSNDSTAMTSHRPYLMRALYEWIADNGMTPHLLVDATRTGVQVPMFAVKDGRIVLNVADRAVSKLEMSNESVRFSARFGGVSHAVSVPIAAVIAIYARETGQGMALPDELVADAEQDALRSDDHVADAERAPLTPAMPRLSAVPASEGHGQDDGGDEPPRPRTGGFKPRVVK